MKGLIIILCFFSLLVYGGAIIKGIQLKQNCTGYLEQAANANQPTTAYQQLSKATAYLEANNLTSGYTSIFYQTPSEDIGFWYNNLKQSENELKTLDSNASDMEKSNVLIKLRETLMDHGKEGDDVTCPSGLSRYPNNAAWAIGMWVCGICLAAGCFYFAALYD